MKKTNKIITKECKTCGSFFSSYKGANRKFCCRECYEKYAQTPEFKKMIIRKIKRGMKQNARSKI
jgi:protein-arginine kinase activator protein McsA